MKLWTEAPLNSEGKADPKDTGSTRDFSAKNQKQFHGCGNHSMGDRGSVLPHWESNARCRERRKSPWAILMWVTSSSATSCGAKSLKPKCLCNIMLLKRDCKLFPPEKRNVPVLLATGLSCSFQHYYIESIPVSTATDLQTANMLHVRL